jgi:hypothetical protein
MLDFNRTKHADFIASGGEMGALTRGCDWSATSIGPVDTWPQSLRTNDLPERDHNLAARRKQAPAQFDAVAVE